MVCRPGLAHQRLTPGNCADLLFDSVLWVHEAQKDHFDFVLKMRERGIEVVDLHDLLGNGHLLRGAECVIDKDLASELLARGLDADLFVMLTDADAVYLDWGSPRQRAIRRASPAALAEMAFAEGSMGPKVQAACRFAAATGKRAAIGALSDLSRIVAGDAGTTVSSTETGILYGECDAG